MSTIGAVRSAIVTELAARPAWTGVDLFRYPAGRFADAANGFTLGAAERVEPDDDTLDIAGELVVWRINGFVWQSGAGDTEDAYATVEDAVLDLFDDFETWLGTVGYGKTLTLSEGAVDELRVERYEVMYHQARTEVGIDFDLAVTVAD